jgi:hypothetical protein
MSREPGVSASTSAPTPGRPAGGHDTRVGSVTLAMLKALHRAHLEGGADSVAQRVRSIASDLDTSPTAVIRGVRVAQAASSAEIAGWASAVTPYVDSAISLGALDDLA